jgi:hypothetical protein
MNKDLLSYLLITLIAFQSVWAITDINQNHEFNALSIQFSQVAHAHHQTNLADDELSDNQLSSQSKVFDCEHHCCHCPQLSLQEALSSRIFSPKYMLHKAYSSVVPRGQLSTLFRPPKA